MNDVLKKWVVNANLPSHNPPAPELLELCDRMGIVVMDEAFDAWRLGKKKNDYHLLFDNWHEKDLRAQIRRDRNHPSIILWSIGNEIGEQGNDEGHALAADLTKIVHEEDPTRPTTAAANNRLSGTTDSRKRLMSSATTISLRIMESFAKPIPRFLCLAMRRRRQSVPAVNTSFQSMQTRAKDGPTFK